jgi:hypothetical protein
MGEKDWKEKAQPRELKTEKATKLSGPKNLPIRKKPPECELLARVNSSRPAQKLRGWLERLPEREGA